MYNIVVDANVWIRFSRSRTIIPLIKRFKIYNLVPVLNRYMLAEIFDALVKNKWASVGQAAGIIDFIENSAIVVAENVVYRLSPDPKDNYLFDLAVQYNCAYIISDDTALLAFRLQPVPVKSCNWFLKNFPV